MARALGLVPAGPATQRRRRMTTTSLASLARGLLFAALSAVVLPFARAQEKPEDAPPKSFSEALGQSFSI